MLLKRSLPRCASHRDIFENNFVVTGSETDSGKSRYCTTCRFSAFKPKLNIRYNYLYTNPSSYPIKAAREGLINIKNSHVHIHIHHIVFLLQQISTLLLHSISTFFLAPPLAFGTVILKIPFFKLAFTLS